MSKKGINTPPKLAIWFLKWFVSDHQIEVLEGDLLEIFESRVSSHGVKKARLYFLCDVFDLLRPFAIRPLYGSQNRLTMLRNYTNIAYRSFLRQKGYSIINISGLAIGLACSFMIYLYVQDELSFDTIHTKADRIFRVPEYFEKDGVGERSASNPFGLGPAMVQEYPHLVEQMVRFFNFQTPVMAIKNPENNREFNESRLFLVDSTLFDVFDYEMIIGNKETALDNPNSILLTETLARKYFEDENPLGKTLIFQGDKLLIVNGVIKDSPLNAHFQFDGFISFSTVKSILPASWLTRFYWNPCWTYLVLYDENDRSELEEQFPNFVTKYFPEKKSQFVTLLLQPLLDIHLTSKLDYEIQANGNKSNIYVFSTIAIFVLLIAAINFINLSTARATKRAKEVGIRKTLGSKKSQLVYQFIWESIIYTIVAGVIALGFVAIALPYFNAFAEKSINIVEVINGYQILSIIGLVLLVGLISGIYPAFVLSSYQPVKVLKSDKQKVGGLSFRKILVTMQFIVSILLLVGTIIAIQQLDLLQNDELGFEKQQVVMVNASRTSVGNHFETLQQEMERHPDVLSVTAVEEIVGSKNQVGNYQFQDMDSQRPFPRLTVRHDFIKTFGMEITAGRDYSREFESDAEYALLVNESFVKSMGWKSNRDALGKTFKRGEGNGKIIGVVKDFNYASKHMPIAPLIMDLDLRPDAFDLFLKYIAVRVTGQNTGDALQSMESSWKAQVPDRPFEYFFLDRKLAQSYKDEMKLSQLTSIFSGLAILVACLGLFGLTTFITEQRTKEIGIRKVLGIKSINLMALLSRDFIILISIAFCLTIPIAYFLLDSWLSEFAYRVNIEVRPFIIAGMSTFFIAIATVSYQVIKAVNINPVNILKDE